MIEILKFEIVNKGALIARFTVKVIKWGGFLIKDCTLFETNSKKWVNFPSKQYEAEGKKKYAPYVCFEDSEIEKKFKDAILKEACVFLSKVPETPPSTTEPDEGFPF